MTLFLVKSFVELVRYIFTIPGVKYFLSERLSQDPLENFFLVASNNGVVQVRILKSKNSVKTHKPYVTSIQYVVQLQKVTPEVTNRVWM